MSGAPRPSTADGVFTRRASTRLAAVAQEKIFAANRTAEAVGEKPRSGQVHRSTLRSVACGSDVE